MDGFSPLLFKSVSEFLLLGRRSLRKLILRLVDVTIFVCALYIAVATRFGAVFPFEFIRSNGWQFFSLILIQYFIFNLCGIYQSTIRYSSLSLLGDAAKAVTISMVTLITLTYFWGDWALARSILIINALATLTLIVSVRLTLRSLIRKGLMDRKGKISDEALPTRLLIYGAGTAGVGLYHSLSNTPTYRIVGFIDDDTSLQGQLLDGREIYAPEEVESLHREQFFDVVVLAIPSAAPQVKRRIVKMLKAKEVAVQTIPSLAGIISGKVSISKIRDVDIVDLLGREEVVPDAALLRQQITDKAVLVTGAGGSIGSELCRHCCNRRDRCGPSRGHSGPVRPLMRVLLLAGTAEASSLAKTLARTEGLEVIASLAGVTEDPRDLPVEVRTGGFGGIEGLRAWLEQNRPAAVIDATHPYAAQMQRHAAIACTMTATPHLRLLRPAWPKRPGWQGVSDMTEAARALPAGSHALLTTGRKGLAPFAARSDLTCTLRTIEPVPGLPDHILPLHARPPFTHDQERATFALLGITHLVTKNAGGTGTAKLDVADALRLTTIVVDRPPRPQGHIVSTPDEAVAWLRRTVGI